MDIKIFILGIFLSPAVIGCHCEEDHYGEVLNLVVPMTTFPDQDTFRIGDTIWMEAYFDKEIEILNSSNTIRMDNFTFYVEMGIAEISGENENYNVQVDTVAEVGSIGYLPLHGALAYPLTFIEEDEYYNFKAAVVLKSPGLFYLFFSTDGSLYEAPYYDHPKLYVCNENRRDRVNVHYHNPHTSLSNYENFFRKTQVDYLLELYDYERYKNLGSISFVVLP